MGVSRLRPARSVMRDQGGFVFSNSAGLPGVLVNAAPRRLIVTPRSGPGHPKVLKNGPETRR